MRFPQTLRGQLLIRVAAVMMVLLALLGLLQYVFLGRYMRESTVTAMRRMTRTAVAKPPGVGLPVNYPELARSLGGPSISVVVLGDLGRRLGAVGPVADALQAAFPRLLGRPEPLLGGLFASVLRPSNAMGQILEFGGQSHLVIVARSPEGPQGAITILMATSTEEIEANLNYLATVTAILGLTGLVLALLASWPLLGAALRPLGQLVQTAGAIAGGDWHRRVESGGSQEIDQAAAAFNHMVEQLRVAFELERDQQEKMRRFVADAAHELRTPLTALNGFVEIMQAGAVTDEAAQHRALASMHGEGQRMARLLADLLMIARLDARSELPMTSEDLGELLQSVLPALEAANPAKPVELEVAGPTPVLCNTDGLKQVVWNLVDNARRYSPQDVPVRITCRSDGRDVVLAIADQGSGIAPKDLPHVFDRFWRGDPSRTRSSGGTGLGLPIVQGIVQAHGGEVHLESEPGKGTIVTVRLPRR